MAHHYTLAGELNYLIKLNQLIIKLIKLMAHHYTLAILLEGAAVLTLLQLIKRYNQSIPEGRKTVRL